MEIGGIIAGAIAGGAIVYFVKEKLQGHNTTPLTNEIERLKREIENKNKRLKELNEENEKLQSDYTNLRSKIKKQESNNDDLYDDLEDAKQKL